MNDKENIKAYGFTLKKNFLLVLCTTVTAVLWSQNPVLKFKTFGEQNGFSDSRIFDAVQDRNGILWTASRLGINRYDGDQVGVYNLPEDVNLNKLVRDEGGNIVAATDQGLCVYDLTKDAFVALNEIEEYKNPIFQGRFFDIIPSVNGGFWIAGNTGSFYWFSSLKNPTEYKIFEGSQLNQNLDISSITAFAEAKNGKLYMGNIHGELFSFDSSTEKLEQVLIIDKKVAVNDLMIDGSNNLWIATGSGLLKYSLDNGETFTYKKQDISNGRSINNDVVLCLFEGKNGRIYIGTDGGGINLYQPENDRFSYIMQGRGEWDLSDNSVLCFAEGLHGQIWAGTVHGGINCFKDRINVHTIPSGQLAFGNDKQSSKIREDVEGKLWITAARDGLRRFDPETSKTEIFRDRGNEKEGFSGKIALSLFQDKQNRIWIGTLRGGINVYDLKSKRFLLFPQGRNLKAIYSITQDADANVWVGTSSGITVFSDQLNPINQIDTSTCGGLTDNVITYIYKDVKNDMWVGTLNGLNLFSATGEFVRSFHSSAQEDGGLSGDHILTIAEGPDLSMYIGTYGHGLNWYSRTLDRFQRIGAKEGLQANVVRGILVDHQDALWLSTNLGMSRIKGSQRIENFGALEGFPPFHGGSATLGRDGQIYFAGSEGLSFFDPEELKSEQQQPFVFFTDFKILGKEDKSILKANTLPKSKMGFPRLSLPPGFLLFTANFSSTDYFDPDHTNYYYKLEGLDDAWHTLGHQKSLSFSNLEPGEYTLRIAAAKGLKLENAQQASLALEVLPSFWQRATTRFSLVALGIFAVYFIVSLRNRSIKKQRDTLKEQVALKTEEVKAEKERAYKSELELLETEKRNEHLKQKGLSDELRFKTEELTNSTLRTMHKNDLLCRIKEELSQEAKNGNRKWQANPLIVEIDDSLDIDTEWVQFYGLFEQVHPNFITNLKQAVPAMTDRDLRLCALIKLNFPSQQIATLFGISLSSVKVARHRLRKKLAMDKGISFDRFFDNDLV